MTVLQSAKGALVGLLNQATGVTHPVTSIDFSAPQPTEIGESAFNTKIRALCNESSNFRGSMVLFYNRVSLNDLQNFEILPAAMIPGQSVYGALDAIRDNVGLVMTQDDLEETFVSSEGPVTVLLQAKPTSLAWTGSYQLAGTNWPNVGTVFSGNLLYGF